MDEFEEEIDQERTIAVLKGEVARALELKALQQIADGVDPRTAYAELSKETAKVYSENESISTVVNRGATAIVKRLSDDLEKTISDEDAEILKQFTTEGTEEEQTEVGHRRMIAKLKGNNTDVLARDSAVQWYYDNIQNNKG